MTLGAVEQWEARVGAKGHQKWASPFGNDSLARLADFAFGALPACPPQRGHGHIQAHPVVVQAAAGAEELVLEVPGAVAQHAVHLVCN